jgi:hypothetical protein
MRLFKLHHADEAKEAPCPRCGVPVPVETLECAVCGWDTRETYVPAEPASSISLPGTATDD